MWDVAGRSVLERQKWERPKKKGEGALQGRNGHCVTQGMKLVNDE